MASPFICCSTHGRFSSGHRQGAKRRHRIGSSAARKLTSHDTVPLCYTGNDWAVVQQAIADNAFAQERLFAHHSDRLYRTAFSVLRNKEDAEDAVQDGLCKAYTNLRSFQGRSSFSTWLQRASS